MDASSAFYRFCDVDKSLIQIDVLKFVYDKMLVYRNEAGEAYKQLASAVKKIVTPSEMQKYMQTIAKGINFIIVGKHQHLMQKSVEQKRSSVNFSR